MTALALFAIAAAILFLAGAVQNVATALGFKRRQETRVERHPPPAPSPPPQGPRPGVVSIKPRDGGDAA